MDENSHAGTIEGYFLAARPVEQETFFELEDFPFNLDNDALRNFPSALRRVPARSQRSAHAQRER